MTAARPLYRRLLREYPPISVRRTPLHAALRSAFEAPRPAAAATDADQLARYLRAQRMYVTLLERYNPGLAGEEDVQEHVRRTARRVGLEIADAPKPKL